ALHSLTGRCWSRSPGCACYLAIAPHRSADGGGISLHVRPESHSAGERSTQSALAGGTFVSGPAPSGAELVRPHFAMHRPVPAIGIQTFAIRDSSADVPDRAT